MELEQVLPLGKGKGKAPESLLSNILQQKPTDGLASCNICFDSTRISNDPFKASTSAATSDRLIYGMYIGDESDSHVYCITCLVRYITGKLEEEMKVVFPLLCPDVSLSYLLPRVSNPGVHQCPAEISDEEAARVLGVGDNLDKWASQDIISLK